MEGKLHPVEGESGDASDSLDAPDANAPVASYGLPQKNYPLESLEVHGEGTSGQSKVSFSPAGPSAKMPVVRKLAIGLVALAILGGIIFVLSLRNTANREAANNAPNDASTRFKATSIPLEEAVKSASVALQGSESLTVNGQLNVVNSLVLTPTLQPTSPITGQLYYDKTTNQLAYYNGTQFVSLTANTPAIFNGVTSLGGLAGVIALGGGLSATNGTLTNTGVLSIGGQTGTITLGNGLAITGGQLRNSGVLSVVSGNGNATVTDDGNGNVTITVAGGGGGANTALSNLAAVAINTSLLPGAAGTVNLGSGTLPFGDLFLTGTSGTPGTNNFRITGTSTGGTRTITLPDATGTVCLENSVTCGFLTGAANDYIQNQNAGDQTANFRITGTGQANTSILTPSLDRASAGTLSIGTNGANTTAVSLGNSSATNTSNGNFTVANDKTLTANGLTVLQPASSLTNGQIGLAETATFANATASGVVRGYQQNLTVSNTTAGTDKGIEINVTDNTSAIANTNKGLEVTLSGSNASQSQIGVDVSASAGVGIRTVASGAPASNQTCGTLTTITTPLAACFNATNANATAVIADTPATGLTLGGSSSYSGTALFGLNYASNAAAGRYAVGVRGVSAPTGTNAFTAIGVYGEAGINTGSATGTTYGGYFTLGSSQTTNGAALYATNSTIAANILQLADNATAVLTVADAGATTFQNSTNSTAAFRVQNAGGTTLLTVDTTNSYVRVGPVASGAASAKLIFGDIGSPANPWIGEKGSTDTDQLQLQGKLGVFISTGASGSEVDNLSISSTGAATFKNSSNSTTAFQIQNAAGTSNLFDADTTNSRIGIGTTAPDAQLQIAQAGQGSQFGLHITEGSDEIRAYTGFGNVWLLFGGHDFVIGNPDNTYTTSGTLEAGRNLILNTHDNSSLGTIQFQVAGTAVGTISRTGQYTLKNTSNSTTAFQIQNSSSASLFTVDTSNARLYVGPVSGDTVGTLLVLGTKTNSGDPTGANGGLYYNSSSHTFRCYRDSAWEPCGINPIDRGFALQDEFMSGTSGSGNISELDWAFNTWGTGTNQTVRYGNNGSLSPSDNHPGILNIVVNNSSPAAATGASVALGSASGSGNTAGTAAMNLLAGLVYKSTVAVSSAANPSVVLRAGIHNQITATAPSSGVWWEADPASSSFWRYCYNNTSTPTCAASGVSIAANTFVRLEIRVTAMGGGTSAATFVIDGNSFTVSSTTFNTTNFVTPNYACHAAASAQEECYIDYFQMYGLTPSQR